MTEYLKTKVAAMDFLHKSMKNSLRIETEVILRISEKNLLSQEHLTFFDFDHNIRHNASILEFPQGYKVNINSINYSALVLAAEIGDLNLFLNEYVKPQTTEAISLAFWTANQHQRLNILEFYYSKDIVKKLNLYKHPLITACKGDKVESFQYLLKKDSEWPFDILAQILFENSVSVLQYIISDSDLSKQILKPEYQIEWVQKLLRKNANDATRMYITYLIGG